MLADLVCAAAVNGLAPVIGGGFEFADALAAYAELKASTVFGKVLIRMA
jgi:NADPH:quinone reductase-like Zn-dependent oxidoreductase